MAWSIPLAGPLYGGPRCALRRLADQGQRLRHDGEQVGQGVVSIRDGALGALAFVLNKCEQRGAALKEGDLISTGMITGVHDVRAGQTSRHVFEGFGEVHCQIEQQGAAA